MVGALHGHQEFADGLGGEDVVLSLSEGFHGSLNKEELLLEIVEAYACINLVPVVDFLFIWNVWVWVALHPLQATTDTLVEQDVEQFLEEEAITEIACDVLDNPPTSESEDLVQEDT